MNEESQLDCYHCHSCQQQQGRIEFAVASSMFFCSCRFATHLPQNSFQDFQRNSKAESSAHEKEKDSPLGMREALQEAFLATEQHTTSS